MAVALVLMPRIGIAAGVAAACAVAVLLIVFSQWQERGRPVAIKVGLDGAITWHRRGAPMRRHRIVGHARPSARLLALRLAPDDEQPVSEKEIDQALVERIQKGDKAAFELLVAKYHRKIIRLISRLVRDPAEVEDVAQDAFIKAYRALPQFRGESAFYTWLYRIAVNTAKNYLATQGRRAPTSTEADAEEAETFSDADQLKDINTPESVLMSKQIAQTVNAAMVLLPEELRTAITLREIEGLSYEEIAEMMGCPIGTVRSRIFRAREAIATKLRPLLDTPEGKRW
ncbi:hypothetical protein DFQ30_001010 [Apophysomyces sp. BC1015]|nr:hypothetical protein DFQ30_001010 [Apophysomyces sp. BC1015]